MIEYRDEPDRWPTEPDDLDDLFDEDDTAELDMEQLMAEFREREAEELLETIADIARTMATSPMLKKQAS